ncbi:MAG: M23 family metallopeptidase [Candidatus Nanopelagicales bacterium]
MKFVHTLRFFLFLMLTLAIAVGAAPSASRSDFVQASVVAQGAFKPPVELPLRLIADFDPPAEKWLAGHRGVDLSATAGSPIKSAGAGVVHFVGTVVDRPVISINHGALRTTYEPVKSKLVTGQSVAAGQVIGTIASGGHCSERCLHWGLKRGEEYLNPLMLLKTDSPVLKPPR